MCLFPKILTPKKNFHPEANSCSVSQENFPPMDPKVSSIYSQEPATGLCPEPDESNTRAEAIHGSEHAN
jgi:hypothetical protein